MKNTIHRAHLMGSFIMRISAAIGDREKEKEREREAMINSHDFIGVGATSSCKFRL